VLPIAMKGLSLALAASDDARSRLEATALAENKLWELSDAALLQSGTTGTTAADGGDFGEAYPGYEWEASSESVDVDLTEVRVRVYWTARGNTKFVGLCSLVYTGGTAGTATSADRAAWRASVQSPHTCRDTALATCTSGSVARRPRLEARPSAIGRQRGCTASTHGQSSQRSGCARIKRVSNSVTIGGICRNRHTWRARTLPCLLPPRPCSTSPRSAACGSRAWARMGRPATSGSARRGASR